MIPGVSRSKAMSWPLGVLGLAAQALAWSFLENADSFQDRLSGNLPCLKVTRRHVFTCVFVSLFQRNPWLASFRMVLLPECDILIPFSSARVWPRRPAIPGQVLGAQTFAERGHRCSLSRERERTLWRKGIVWVKISQYGGGRRVARRGEQPVRLWDPGLAC